MGRPALPSTDPSTAWLASLIKATEAAATASEPCDAATVKAFSDRLEMRAGHYGPGCVLMTARYFQSRRFPADS
jgi:hypothetical protein